MKVILNKTIKWKGQFEKAGTTIEVTDKEKATLEKDDHIGSKEKFVSNEVKHKELLAEIEELKKGSDKELKAENKILKAENEDLKKELVKLAGGKEENKGLLDKFGLGGK